MPWGNRHVPGPAPARSCASPAGCEGSSENSSNRGGPRVNDEETCMSDYLTPDEHIAEAMRLRLRLADEGTAGAHIKVIGVGGGGSKAQNPQGGGGPHGRGVTLPKHDGQGARPRHTPGKLRNRSNTTEGPRAG